MKILVNGPSCSYHGEITVEDVDKLKAKYLQMAGENDTEAEDMLREEYGFQIIDDCESPPIGIEQEWGD